MVTKEELRELLSVLNYYLIGGLALGIACATITASSGITFFQTSNGLPVSAKVITVAVVVLIGAVTGLLAYLILLPAELKLVRKKLKPKILARRLSGRK